MAALSKRSLRDLLMQEKPLVEGYLDLDLQLQPNGFDLSLKEIGELHGPGHLDFDNRERRLPRQTAVPFGTNTWLHLGVGCYVVTFNEIVNIPLDIVAIGYPRSTLLRMGATIEAAVWDAGYSGRSRSLLVVHNLHGIRLQRNARILQMVFIKLDRATDPYHGIYREEN